MQKRLQTFNEIADILYQEKLTLNDLGGRRQLLMLESYHLFREKPLFGNGIGQTVPILKNKNGEYSRIAAEPHNTPLLILAETGIVGFFLFYLFFLRLIFYFRKYRNSNSFSLGFYCIIFGYLILSFGNEYLIKNPIVWLFFGLAVANEKTRNQRIKIQVMQTR